MIEAGVICKGITAPSKKEAEILKQLKMLLKRKDTIPAYR